MNKKLIFIFTIFNLISSGLMAQYYDDPVNHDCLKCHSRQTFSFHNEFMDREEKKLMNPFLILDTIGIRNGVHKAFDCTDCHNYDYTTYPHEAYLKLEPLATCIDCHGGDESYATYQFDRIDEEFQKSVHYQAYGDNFSCAKCHSQHTYKPMARTSYNVLEIVDYSNRMCLSCHNDMRRYELVSGEPIPQIVDIHNWLPNRDLHFKHVRCIECHTDVNDDLMVSHNILKKENAVRKCVECHSTNSLLKASLYKYQNLQERSQDKSIFGVLSNESYVIGTQQLPILKKLSIIIFLLAFVGIFTHGIFRYLKK